MSIQHRIVFWHAAVATVVHEFDVVPDGWTDDVHFSPSIGVPRLGLSLLKFNVVNKHIGIN